MIKMKPQIANHFLNKFVKLERLSPSDTRPFKLYGTVVDITDESLVLQTKQGMGAIRLCDILSITECKNQEGRTWRY